MAQLPPTVSQSDKDQATAAIRNWRGFEGTWEGEMRYLAAPQKDWLKQRLQLRVVKSANEVKAHFRSGIRDWTELGTTYTWHQPDHLTLVVHAYDAGDVWTENHVLILTRQSEGEAQVYVQRVVNNWVQPGGSDKPPVFGDTRAGRLSRR